MRRERPLHVFIIAQSQIAHAKQCFDWFTQTQIEIRRSAQRILNFRVFTAQNGDQFLKAVGKCRGLELLDHDGYDIIAFASIARRYVGQVCRQLQRSNEKTGLSSMCCGIAAQILVNANPIVWYFRYLQVAGVWAPEWGRHH